MSDKILARTNKTIPWGNFALYYEALNPDATLIKGTYQFETSELMGHIHQLVNCCDKKDILSIQDSVLSLKNLVLNLSDLHDYLKNKGISPNLYYGTMLKNSLLKTGLRANGKVFQQDTIIDYHLLISGLKEECIRNWFIDEYKQREIVFQPLTDSDLTAKLSEIVSYGNIESKHNLPEAVNSFNGNMYYIYQPENYLFESASFYVISFILGMICRYHPDIWIDKLENVDGFPELISYLLDIMQVKIPYLILNQITDTLYVFE